MCRDPIVEEIRQLRQQYAARFHHNLKTICHDLREREKKNRRQVVALPPRPAQPVAPKRQPAAS